MAVFEIGFSGNPLDRLSQIRGDAAAVAELAADPAALAAVFVQSMPILRSEGALACTHWRKPVI